MKKCIMILVAAALAMSLFVSCAKKETAPAASQGGSGDANAPVKLTVWCWDPAFNIYAMKVAEEIYQREHPNVSLEIVETPWNDLQQKVIAALSSNQANTLPDILLMQDRAIEKNYMTYPNAWLPVDGKVDLSQFASFKKDCANFGGKAYAVPFDNAVACMTVRKDIVEKAGLKVEDFNDITWERFIELARIVKQKTNLPMLSYVSTDIGLIPLMVQSAGSWIFDENGNTDMKDNPVLKKSFEIFSTLVNENLCVLLPDQSAYVASLNSGSVAGMINGCWMIASIQLQPNQSGLWAMTNVPRFSDVPNATNYSCQGGSSWMVTSASKHPDVAMDFLNKTFAGSVELYDTILESSAAVTTWAPGATAAAYDKPNEFFGGQKIYKDMVDYAEKVPMVKYGVFFYEARDALAVANQRIKEGATIDAALLEAHQNLDFIMGK